MASSNKTCGFSLTLLFTFFVSSASIVGILVTPALPNIKQSFHLSVLQTQMITTVFLLAYLLGQMLYGPLAKRFGRVNAVTIGMTLNFLGQLICVTASFLHNYGLLLDGRFVSALGAAAGLVCIYMIIHELYEQRQAKKVTARALAGFTIGSGLAVILGGVMTHYLGWQSCFIFLAVYAFALLVTSRVLPEPKLARDSSALKLRVIAETYMTGFKSKKLWLYSFIVGCVTLFNYAYAATAPLIAHNLFGLHSAAFAYFNIINTVAMFAGSIIVSLVDFNVSLYSIVRTLLLLMLILLVILFLLTDMTHNVFVFFVLSALLYFTSAFLLPNALSLALHAIRCKASASSTSQFLNMCVALLGVTLVGWVPIGLLGSFCFILIVAYALGLFFVMAKPMLRIGHVFYRRR